MATISFHHVRACLHGVRYRGLAEEELIARAGINPELWFNPKRVHVEQAARLFRLVQLKLQDEFMGFTAQPCKLGVFATMCQLVSHCRTVGELLEKGCGFYALLSDEVTLNVEVLSAGDSRNAVFSVSLLDATLDPDHFLAEFLLVIWHRFTSWYIGEAISLKETHFAHSAPRHRKELEIMFPGQLCFNRRCNRLVFDAAYLDKPLLRTERELEVFLQKAPADLMTIPGVDNSLEGQVERLLLRAGAESLSFPSVTEVADALALTPQALHRELKKVGASYQKIKDNLRREIAIDKLLNEHLSVEQISELLGYSEARSFTRAFKKWTGLSPRAYCKLYPR